MVSRRWGNFDRQIPIEPLEQQIDDTDLTNLLQKPKGRSFQEYWDLIIPPTSSLPISKESNRPTART